MIGEHPLLKQQRWGRESRAVSLEMAAMGDWLDGMAAEAEREDQEEIAWRKGVLDRIDRCGGDPSGVSVWGPRP